MTLANKVTMLRIALVPVFLLALVAQFKYQNVDYSKYIAALIFIIAASTDGIDGYIARKRQQVTTLGKFLDPLADKLLVTAALIWLVEQNEIPSWAVIIIVAREFIVTGLRMVAAGEGLVIAASIWGKIKTVTQIIAIIAVLIHDLAPFKMFLIDPIPDIIVGLAVIITIYSGYDYVYKNRNVIK